MQFIVKSGASTPEEKFIIEMQGDLESRNKEHLEGKFIGDLHYTKDGTPIIIIGHHILYGKVVVLDKPLVALEKIQVSKDGSDSLISGNSDGEEMMDLDAEMETKTEYRVKSIIRKKLVFKTRPKPIIVVPKVGESN
eukprot:GFUD01010958.1.p1 GENE.GFUD01010958.1~~GFUD01010958.1.p1  ORF type:complete len:150 (-),score=37.18 GFUD01010958.1:95-505(-)